MATSSIAMNEPVASGVARPAFRLAAFDLDGTLVGPDGRIGAANAEAVARLRRAGTHVVLASGRSHANILPFHRELGLRGPIVSVHGAVVRDGETGEVLHRVTVPADVVRAVTLEGRARGAAVVYYRDEGIFLERRTRITEFDQERNTEPQVHVADLLALDLETVEKVMWLADADVIAALAAEAAARYGRAATATLTEPEYFEFTPAGVDKSYGVARVARDLGVAREEVLAAGDANNDAPMLAWAGLGVAVAHATPLAREAADVVGPAGDPADALARALAGIFDTGRGM
jgi:Cof subfamily protein (haloacid dehalogenase superfamily)